MDADFYESRPFLKQIADAFQRVADGHIKRLSVSLPPRAGKSYITSMFSAWIIGKYPQGSVMRNCCTATLYDKFSYDTREIMKNEKFLTIFPLAELDPDRQPLRGWATTAATQVSFFGAGVGGTIIGFGATLVAITDDLFRSIEDAVSEKVCDSTHSWYRGTHVSRMEKECPAIDIGTRWSKKDIIGKNIEDGYYDESIVVAALNEKEQSFCEAVKSTKEYMDIRYRSPRQIWMAEYMQSPIEASGTLFVPSDLKRFKMADLRLFDVAGGKKVQRYESCMGYIDVADEGTDRLAFLVGHIFPGKVYITDVIFTDANIDVTLPLCVGLINRTEADYVRVEANNQGTQFMRSLREYIDPGRILKVNNTQNKHTRILMAYGFIKEHFYFRDDYERGSEYDLFMQELFDYTKSNTSTHDDAPDATAGLAKFIRAFVPHLFESLKGVEVGV